MRAYVEVYRALKVAAVFEKVSAESPELLQREAAHCDALFDLLVKQASVAVKLDTALPRKEERAAKVAHAALELVRIHQFCGEKVAASAEQTADLLTKLAAVAYIDAMLEEQMLKMSGESLFLTRNAQLLGREYAVNILREMIA